MQAYSFSEIHLPHWESMTDKSRRHHAEEGEAEGRGEASELQAILRMFLESAAKDKLDAEKREEEREIRREEEKAARRREEVRELAELNERRDKQREEAARQVTERLREEQQAFAEEERKKQQEAIDRAYEHQKTLVKLQAESGAKADEARRVEAAKADEVRRAEAEASRKRDRALAGIPSYRDQEDVEDYLITSERKLVAGKVDEEEWVSIFASKLGGKVGSTWQDLCMAGGGYQDVKAALLKVCGYTPKLAGDAFFGYKAEAMRGLSADQVYHRGAQLLRRMVAPNKLTADLEFAILRHWVGFVVPRKARLLLDARVIATPVELIGALQDHLMMEGERAEGQVAVFKKLGHSIESSGGEKRMVGSCFKCGKPGHKAADCWQRGGAGVPGTSKPTTYGSSGGRGIICFTCNEEGHRSTQCPRIKKEKVNSKEGQAKPVRRLWSREEKDTVVSGEVNGKKVEVVLDSGASVSVVPENMIGEGLRTGEYVAVKAFQSEEPVRLPLAKVMFKIDHLEWEEEVALAPEVNGQPGEVLCRFDVRSDRGWELAGLVREQARVRRVTTRSEEKKEKSEKQKDSVIVAAEKPRVKEPGKKAEKPRVRQESASEDVDPGEGKPAVDRPAGNPDPGPVIDSSAEEKEEIEDLLDGEELFEVKPKSKEAEQLEIPPVKAGGSKRDEMSKELRADPSLEEWRGLANREEQGFSWDRGLMFQAVTTHTLEVEHLLVLPKKYRKRVMALAHEKCGHLGARKVKALVRQRFAWPEMAKDVVGHCQSREVCQTCRKSKARKAPMMEREILSEPFEVLAMDLVGPFPKGKGGYTYLLTTICMSSKWPEAIPLKSITARAVAEGMLNVFARTGIPLQLLTDQGSQFVGSLVAHMCRDLHIEKIKTAPYHPECNGVVERMHGTLGAMLTKAAALGQDWVGQVPFALFALRSSPNRDTKFSPFELVYGHRVRTPLDILHQGWVEVDFKELNTEEWSEWLVARLESWHEIQRERMKKASENRKKEYDKHAVERTLSEGDLVLCRVPGMTKKLREAWHGPYPVMKALNRVDYRVKLGKGRSKVLHINNLKRYYPRGEEVLRLTVIAEDVEEEDGIGTRLHERDPELEDEVVEQLKLEFPNVFSDLPGSTKVAKLEIKTGEAEPRASHPHRVPDRLKEGVRAEIEKLVELGIVVPSSSPWASPIVPVPKSDGTVRVCIDYRQLNEVTQGDPFYMVTLEEILERVGEASVMSKLDLAKGFYQVEVEAQSQEKTAFVCPFGKFEFRKMPFGLKNAPALFQRCMEVVLHECYGFSAPYIDDVLVFSMSVSEHVQHLREVLGKLEEYGMTVKESKCVFGRRKLEYLGHLIGGGQLAVPEHRAEAMANYLLPKTRKQLRSFLGAAGYYRQFVPAFANLSQLLTPGTSKSAPSVVEWTEEKLEAFKAIKVSLVKLCVLTIPNQGDVFCLHTDASGVGVGATLNVQREGKSRPVAFYSKQLQGAQHRYSATELEALAIFKSINYFSHFLFGSHFVVVTDHKALVALLRSRRLNKRLQGWMLQLEQYDFDIIYRAGRDNLDADALSRQAWGSGAMEPWKTSKEKDAVSAEEVGGDVGTSPTEKEGEGRERAREREEKREEKS